MKKNKIIISCLAIFFSIDALLGWWFGSYCIPRTTPSEDHVKLIERIVVEKALRKMTLLSKNDVIAIYDISLGFNPTGNKEKKDDGRTPEGRYFIAEKIANSKNTLSLKISYYSLTLSLKFIFYASKETASRHRVAGDQFVTAVKQVLCSHPNRQRASLAE